MTETPNLAIPHIAASQNQKEVTANEAFDLLDRAGNDSLALDFTSGNITLTAAFRCENVSAARTLTVPQGKRLFVVINLEANAEPVTVARGGTQVEVAPGLTFLFYTDGTAHGLFAIGGVGAGGGYDLVTFIPGKPDAGALVWRLAFVGAVTFPADLTGSVALARVAADASAEFDLRKNGVAIGTLTFAAASDVGTFSLAGGAAFVSGDTVELIAPSPADADLEDLSISLAGQRARRCSSSTASTPIRASPAPRSAWRRAGP